MNYYFKIIFIVLAINFVSCEKEKDFVVINGKISGDIPQQIEYSLPINGIDFFGIKDSVQPDSLGNFKIKLQLEKTSFVEFFNDLKYYGTLITEPHKNYNIQINIRDSIDFNVQGKTSQAQKTYNKLSSKTLLDGYFSEESINNFFSKEFEVTKLTDRMGMRLKGIKLNNIKNTNIKSEGLVKGTVQVPADGNPIILLSDHGTIGGYPKFGVVISADYDKLVQIPPGSKIKFKEIELKDAENLYKLYDMETNNILNKILWIWKLKKY